MDPVVFIIQNIQEGIPDSTTITQLQTAGFDDEVILDAFADAYAELNLVATDQVLEQLARSQSDIPAKILSPADIKRTKLIGAAVIFFGLSVMILVAIFLLNRTGGASEQKNGRGNIFDVPMIPAPEQTQLESESLDSTSTEKTLTIPSNQVIDPMASVDRLTIPIDLELDYNKQDFTYRNACNRVRELIPPGSLISCVKSDTYYRFVYLKNNNPYCSDSSGNFELPLQKAVVDTENCLGETFAEPSPVKTPTSDQSTDERFKAENYNDPTITFAEPAWMLRETLCLEELFTIDWYASSHITDVIVGIYQPGFNEPEVKTIGTFPATNNPDRITGYGTFLWNVGVTRDYSLIQPGSGYRFVVQDADGSTKAESQSFSIARCQQ